LATSRLKRLLEGQLLAGINAYQKVGY
jgi:hypothetical protein